MPKSTLWNGQPAIVSISSTREHSQQKINLNSKGCFMVWISSLLLKSSSSALMTKPGSAAVCLQSSCSSRLSQTAKLSLWSASVLEAWSWCTASESWSICTDKGTSRLVLSSMTFNCGQERTSSIPKRHMRSAWERPTTAASSTANSTTYILVKITPSARCNLWCSQAPLLSAWRRSWRTSKMTMMVRKALIDQSTWTSLRKAVITSISMGARTSCLKFPSRTD